MPEKTYLKYNINKQVMEEQDPFKKLQDQMKKLIGTESTVKRRKKTKEETQREVFLTTIPLLEHILNRGIMLESDYGFNTIIYDEPFYQIIDSLIYMHFNEDAADLIMFYLYERVNPDGTFNFVTDINGDEFSLENAEDLWILVQQITEENKNKDAGS
jgi:hypothetical protein